MPHNPLNLLNIPKQITRGAIETRLPKPLRAELEKAFDVDFSNIKVMQSHLPTLNGSDAFTKGNELHFAPGKFDPSSESGRQLIGHELAHVVQQRGGTVAANAASLISDALGNGNDNNDPSSNSNNDSDSNWN